jgi:hypothetical protein
VAGRALAAIGAFDELSTVLIGMAARTLVERERLVEITAFVALFAAHREVHS